MLHKLDKALAARNFELTLSYPRGVVRDMLQKANEVMDGHHHGGKSLAARTFDSINEAIAGKAKSDAGFEEKMEAARTGAVQLVTLRTDSEHGDNDGGAQDKKNTVTIVETQRLSASLGN